MSALDRTAAILPSYCAVLLKWLYAILYPCFPESLQEVPASTEVDHSGVISTIYPYGNNTLGLFGDHQQAQES